MWEEIVFEIFSFFTTIMAIKNLMHQIYLHKGVPLSWYFFFVESFHVSDKFLWKNLIKLYSSGQQNPYTIPFRNYDSLARYNGIKISFHNFMRTLIIIMFNTSSYKLEITFTLILLVLIQLNRLICPIQKTQLNVNWCAFYK